MYKKFSRFPFTGNGWVKLCKDSTNDTRTRTGFGRRSWAGLHRLARPTDSTSAGAPGTSNFVHSGIAYSAGTPERSD